MQRVQRKVGTFLKRSADNADVGTILAEFQTADKLLDKVSSAETSHSSRTHGSIVSGFCAVIPERVE